MLSSGLLPQTACLGQGFVLSVFFQNTLCIIIYLFVIVFEEMRSFVKAGIIVSLAYCVILSASQKLQTANELTSVPVKRRFQFLELGEAWDSNQHPG